MSSSHYRENLKILPAHLLSLSLECMWISKEKLHAFLDGKYFLPDTSSLFGESHFADVALAWNEEGLACSVYVHQPFQGVSLPNIEEGDGLSLFIDTRDVKSSAYNTRFCHHFTVLPKEVEGVHAQEVTHFRGSEKRALCKPELIETHSKFSKFGYQVHVFLPAEALFGFDTQSSSHIGFSYAVYQAHGEAQHFSCSSHDFKIEETPSLWSSVKLVKN